MENQASNYIQFNPSTRFLLNWMIDWMSLFIQCHTIQPPPCHTSAAAAALFRIFRDARDQNPLISDPTNILNQPSIRVVSRWTSIQTRGFFCARTPSLLPSPPSSINHTSNYIFLRIDGRCPRQYANSNVSNRIIYWLISNPGKFIFSSFCFESSLLWRHLRLWAFD